MIEFFFTNIYIPSISNTVMHNKYIQIYNTQYKNIFKKSNISSIVDILSSKYTDLFFSMSNNMFLIWSGKYHKYQEHEIKKI